MRRCRSPLFWLFLFFFGRRCMRRKHWGRHHGGPYGWHGGGYGWCHHHHHGEWGHHEHHHEHHHGYHGDRDYEYM